MTYEVTIKELHEVEGKNYPETKEIYQQTVEDLDILAVIRAVNKIDSQE